MCETTHSCVALRALNDVSAQSRAQRLRGSGPVVDIASEASQIQTRAVEQRDRVPSQTRQPLFLPTAMPENGETAPLLGDLPNLARNVVVEDQAAARARRAATVRAVTYSVLTTVFVVALAGMFLFWDKLSGWVGRLPKDPHKAALLIMDSAPVIVSDYSHERERK